MAVKNPGSFIPTTTLFDISQVQSIEVTSQEFKDLLVRLYQTVNNIAFNLNDKEAGLYSLDEYVTGGEYFPNPAYDSASSVKPDPRQVYRKVINFGALPNAAPKNVAHGVTINANLTFTRIYGCASDPAGNVYLPLPYASTTLINGIELSVGAANVTITTGINRTAFTECFVVLEFIKR